MMLNNSSTSTPFIVGLTGFKGSGKSEAANILESRGYARYSFAEPLKRACKEVFGLSHAQLYDPVEKEKTDPFWEMSPREIMQLFGTEAGRAFSQDLWVKALMRRLRREAPSRVVIDDVRFLNEAEAIHSMGGVVIGVNRLEAVPERSWRDFLPTTLASLLRIPQLHESELNMFKNWSDLITLEISNDGSLYDLENSIFEALHLFASKGVI